MFEHFDNSSLREDTESEALEKKIENSDSLEDLRKQHQKNDLKQLHLIRKWGIYLIAGICAFIVISYFWNLAGFGYKWLSAEEMRELRDLAISISVGVIASLVNSYFLQSHRD